MWVTVSEWQCPKLRGRIVPDPIQEVYERDATLICSLQVYMVYMQRDKRFLVKELHGHHHTSRRGERTVSRKSIREGNFFEY